MERKQYTNEPNTCILWSNANKTKSGQPDYTGKIVLPDGKEMPISIWVNKTKNGGTMLNGKISNYQNRPQNSPATQQSAAPYQSQAANFPPAVQSEVAAFEQDFAGDDLPL